MMRVAKICISILLALCFNGLAVGALTLEEQDAKFRQQIVAHEQVRIEKDLIASQNGVFILFTPSAGTPQMISEAGDVPEGLIPKKRLGSYETTVKPRVETTHHLPIANVRSIFIRYQKHRPHADEPNKVVDDKYYKEFVATHPNLIQEKIIPADKFTKFQSQGMPSAFYYYVPKGSSTPVFVAIFGKQINAKDGNKLSDPGAYYNRARDLRVVNKVLTELGLGTVEELQSRNSPNPSG